MLSTRLVGAARSFSTTAVKKSGYGGVPGENLPFKLSGPLAMTVKFIVFLAVPMALPFVVIRHQILKK